MNITGERPIALITGAARRVGRATSLALARAGCDIIATYRTSDDEAHSLRDELSDHGAACQLQQLDLADLDVVSRLGAALRQSLPRLDVLVHNASLYQRTPLKELTAEAALAHFRINALAPLLLTKELTPLLRASALPAGGAVVAMCDVHVLGRPRTDFTAYSLSKAALTEMVHTLARELAPNIRVNGVAPGVVAFPESGHESDPKSQATYLSRVPLNRAGTPEEAAEVVRWLALDASYLTGQIVRVDGGRWLA